MVTIFSNAPKTYRDSGFIWMPTSSPIYKVEIIDSNNVSYDVTNIVLDGTSFTLGTTEVIGVFTLKIDNSASTYTDKFVAGNTVNLYMDYGSTATTKRFKGKIDRVSGQLSDQYIYTITGRATYANLREINVTTSFLDTEASVALKSLFTTYASNYTTVDYVTTTTTNITIGFQGKPFWDCIVDICSASGMDCYIDTDDKVHFLVQNSVENATDAIVVGQNHLETGEFGLQTDEVRNLIKVYGAEVDGIPQMKFAEDLTSQAAYGIKEEIITDSNLILPEEIQATADSILALKKDPPAIGKVTSYILCTIQPAELLKISDQQNGLRSSYRLISLTHYLNHTDIPKSEVTLNREPLAISKIIKGRYASEQSIVNLKNRNDMKQSRILTFDDETDTSSHSNTIISESALYWDGSGINGTFISTTSTESEDITSLEVKANGSNITNNVTFFISTDGGIGYTNCPLNTVVSFVAGKSLKIKIQINDSSVFISTLGILFK